MRRYPFVVQVLQYLHCAATSERRDQRVDALVSEHRINVAGPFGRAGGQAGASQCMISQQHMQPAPLELEQTASRAPRKPTGQPV